MTTILIDSRQSIVIRSLTLAVTVSFPLLLTAQDTIFPGARWEEATPESQGVDSARLAAATELLARTVGRDGASELVIIRHGRMIWKGDNIDKVHGVWSFTKSFTSTALGLLIDDGKCALDTPARTAHPALAEHYPRVTLRHFTTMTSGYRAIGDEPRESYIHGPSRTPFAPNPEPLFTPPGSQYAYWDSAMNEFGNVLAHIAGEPLEQFIKRRIADPIGMNPEQWRWGNFGEVDGVVVNGGAGNNGKDVQISAREAARFGLLYLNKGEWNGKQLISAEWVGSATRVQVASSNRWAQPASEIDARGLYGFNWWVNGLKPDGARKFSAAPAGMFWAWGHNNNMCFVIPEWDMVIVRLGLDGKAKDEVWNGFLAKVGEAVEATGSSDRAAFSFRHHYIDPDLPGTSYAQTCLVDVDKDGDLDFITGGNAEGRTVFWFEFQGADKWTRHVVGRNHPSDVGGTALDVDGDGWPDHVTGGVWYRNPGQPRTEPFERIVFDATLAAVHDLVAADLDRDGRPEIITMSDKNNLRWYRIPMDPRRPWERHDIGVGVHAGVAVGDIDGDGDPDIARSSAWFENADGKGLEWNEHPIPFGNPKQPYPFATRCVIVDINKDGRMDLVMTENEIRAGKIVWLENVGGNGLNWNLHELPAGDLAPRGAYHSLAVADFDRDGDADIFTVEMEGIPGARSPRWFIWENADGKGAKFVERVILDNALGGHEAVVADVDGDGDLDICSKLWRPRSDNANGGRNHADFVENLIFQKAGSR